MGIYVDVLKYGNAKHLYLHNIGIIKIKNSHFLAKYFINTVYSVFICKVFNFYCVHVLLRSWIVLPQVSW